MKKGVAKRILAGLLCVTMIFSSISVNAFAEELSDGHAEIIDNMAAEESLMQEFSVEGDGFEAEDEILEYDEEITEESPSILEDESGELIVDDFEAITDEETELFIDGEDAETEERVFASVDAFYMNATQASDNSVYLEWNYD